MVYGLYIKTPLAKLLSPQNISHIASLKKELSGLNLSALIAKWISILGTNIVGDLPLRYCI